MRAARILYRISQRIVCDRTDRTGACLSVGGDEACRDLSGRHPYIRRIFSNYVCAALDRQAARYRQSYSNIRRHEPHAGRADRIL